MENLSNERSRIEADICLTQATTPQGAAIKLRFWGRTNEELSPILDLPEDKLTFNEQVAMSTLRDLEAMGVRS